MNKENSIEGTPDKESSTEEIFSTPASFRGSIRGAGGSGEDSGKRLGRRRKDYKYTPDIRKVLLRDRSLNKRKKEESSPDLEEESKRKCEEGKVETRGRENSIDREERIRREAEEALLLEFENRKKVSRSPEFTLSKGAGEQCREEGGVERLGEARVGGRW